jgi:hypothetical protein
MKTNGTTADIISIEAVRSGAVEAGERLGFYDTIAVLGATDGAELATRARIARRDADAWLEGQHRAGYVDRDTETGAYRLFCPLPRAA